MKDVFLGFEENGLQNLRAKGERVSSKRRMRLLGLHIFKV